jgi:hypothetical protein
MIAFLLDARQCKAFNDLAVGHMDDVGTGFGGDSACLS